MEKEQKTITNANEVRQNKLNVPTLRFDGFGDNWTIATLSDVCSYRKERRTLEKKYYVSTENILQNYQGIERFDSNDKISGDAFDKNDVLMGNIRPYLKKCVLLISMGYAMQMYSFLRAKH